MIKKVFLAVLLTLGLGLPIMKAQDSYPHENYLKDTVLSQAKQTDSTSTRKRTPNKFAIAFQAPYSMSTKNTGLGLGLRLSYDLNSVLRFTLDGDYYFYTRNKFDRKMEWNPNINFVWGGGDFHFYLATGIFISMDKNNESVSKDQTSKVGAGYNFGAGYNIGCGCEYQFTDVIRVFFEQKISFGFSTTSLWALKLGCAFCL